MAIISELIPTFSPQDHLRLPRHRVLQRVARAGELHRLGPPHVRRRAIANWPTVVFSALTFLVAIPSGVKMFNWLTTMYKGNISFETPMLYAMAFLMLFAISSRAARFQSYCFKVRREAAKHLPRLCCGTCSTPQRCRWLRRRATIRDLSISCVNSGVLALDNLSGCPPWLIGCALPHRVRRRLPNEAALQRFGRIVARNTCANFAERHR